MTLPFDNDTSRIVKKLAKRSLAAEKRRNLLICCTIAFAVALMTGLSFFAAAQKAKVERDIRGQYQVMILRSTQERVDSLAAQPEVERWGLSSTFPLSRYQDSVLSVLYADTNWMALGNKPAVEGQMPQGEHEILVESAFLDYFHLPHETGQQIKLDLGRGEQTYMVTGILQTENLSRMFEIIVSKAFVTAYSDGTPEFEFRMCYRGGEQMDSDHLKEDILTFLAAQEVPEQDIFFSSDYFNMEGFRNNAGGYALPAALVILLACGMVIYNIFYISVKGKVKEYGRLKVIGATPRQIRRIVRYESIYLFLLGIPAGLVIGSVIAFACLPAYWSWTDNSKVAVVILAMTGLMIFLSTDTPVRMAAKVSPIEAVRTSNYAREGRHVNSRRPHRRLTPSVLSKMNFERSGRKAAITLASLSLSGILLLTAATLYHSINFNSMAAKYMGDGGNYMISWQDAVDMEKIPEQALDNPLYDDLREQILALPDVDAITSYDAVTVEIDLPRKADTFIITAMRREQFSQQLPDNRIAAGTADYDALAEGNGILISDSSDHILSGYDYTPQIGDVLHLKTYGGQDMDLNVMGIVKEGSRDATGVLASLFILPEETLHKLYPEVKNFQMVWNVHAAQDSDVLRTQLFQIAENPALTIIVRSDLTATLQTSFRELVRLVYLFTAFLFVFALVNLTNTLITNLLTRRQELGILQSVGMTRKQLSRMLSWECLRYISGALGATVILGSAWGAVLILILNRLNVLGVPSYCFPMWELTAFVCALLIIHCLYILFAIRYMKQQSIAACIRAAG